MARRVEEVAAKRRTQSERKAESERRLIIAARRLFAEQGYMRTTLSGVLSSWLTLATNSLRSAFSRLSFVAA